MEGLKLYSKKSQRSLPTAVPLDRDVAEYPSEFFERARVKPQFQYVQVSNTLEDLRQMVAGMIQVSELDLEVCKAYLIAVLLTQEEVLQNDWVSFGVIIGKRGDKVNPFCMVQMAPEGLPRVLDSQQKSSQVNAADDLWMCMYLLCFYRLGKITNKTYLSTILDRMNSMLLGYRKDVAPLSANLQAIEAWHNDSGYCKIVACVDMFYSMFKKSPMAAIRVGTIPARYRDCAALTAMAHFSKLLGQDLAKCLEWSFVGRVSDEIEALLQPGQELDNPFSYTPYMMELGLSRASPYSTVRNPCWHLFCHSIGALMQSTRSINARHLEAADQSNILANAELVVYVFETHIVWAKNFRPEGTMDASDALDSLQPETLGTSMLPASVDADAWFSWMKLHNFTLPSQCVKHCEKNARKLKNSRESSIGKYVASRLAD
ncbi:nucleoprotein [Klamath virus]|uniref:Nucleoprotein n=1 Tax=Klamath virus TaxID=909206 RepID=A0A0D3R167_9RHAB|nr:nucleoprotein [Klamath virus]AJR28403.1 nucleoprotein [Klamath virus]